MANTEPAKGIDWKKRAIDSGFPAFPVAIVRQTDGSYKKTPMVAGWTKNPHYPDDWDDRVWARAQGYGIPTGSVSGLYVLDVDSWKPNCEAEDWLVKMKVPMTAQRDTISGGKHLVFKLPDEHLDTPNRAGIVPGLDGRGTGGYFVGEGQVGNYGYSPIAGGLATLPAEVCKDLKANHSGNKAGNIYLPLPVLDEAEKDRLRNIVKANLDIRKALSTNSGDGSADLFALANTCWREGYTAEDFAGLTVAAEKFGGHAHVFKPGVEPERALGRAWAGAEADKTNVRKTLTKGTEAFQKLGTGEASGTSVAPSVRRREMEDLFGTEAVERAERAKQLGPFADRMRKSKVDARSLANFDPLVSVPSLLKGMIPQEGIGVLYGASGIGKSFVAMDLMLKLASGEDWNGRRNKAAGGGNWVYVSSEGGATELGVRLLGWCKENGVGLPTGCGFHATAFAWGEGGEDAKRLVDWCRAEFGSGGGGGGGVRMVVVDTLNRNMVGDENSTRDMTAFVNCCQEVSRSLGCVVLVVHHEGKDEARGARGSSALKGAADFEWRVFRDTGTMVGGVFVDKNRHGPDGMTFGFQLEPVVFGVDADGDEVSTLVVKASKPPAKQRPLGKYASRVAEAYEELAPANGWLGVDELTRRAADIHEEAGNKRVPPSQFKRALKDELLTDHGWELLDDAVKCPGWGE